MKRILALGASNSSTSINKTFALYTASKLKDVEVISLDWENLILPLYSPDLENASGIPQAVSDFYSSIGSIDGIIISFAEYNSMPTAAFVNLFDWLSRINKKLWQDKPMLVMAASPGGRGGAGVLGIMSNLLPHYGAKIVGTFSLANFHSNFKDNELIDAELKLNLEKQLKAFKEAVDN